MNYDNFLLRATERHGGKYSYPQWPGETPGSAKIPIVCPEHGSFLQQINSHLGGCGCKPCGVHASADSKRGNFLDIVERATKIHKGRYAYPAPEQPPKNNAEKLKIICPEHGPFLQSINSHLQGKGCRACADKRNAATKRASWEEIFTRAAGVHASKYSYPAPTAPYKNSRSKLAIVCPEHGKFSQEAATHLAGGGCPICAQAQRIRSCTLPYAETLHLATEVHANKFSYGEVEASRGRRRRLLVICPTHGEFLQDMDRHLRGDGCRRCAREALRVSQSFNFAQTLQGIKDVHGDRYTVLTTPDTFLGFPKKVSMYCAEPWKNGRPHGEFLALPNNLSRGQGCPACARKLSKGEAEVRAFIESLGFETIKARKDTFPQLERQEFDIYIEKLSLAIEFNGIIWHSERFGKPRDYHLKKTELAKTLGIRLIHLFEDEWFHQQELVKQRLRAILGAPGVPRVFARQTSVSQITYKAAAEFLKKTHSQGAGPRVEACLGLHAGSTKTLVAVATFGKGRYGNSGWELLRFATEGRVIGGASKLLKFFKINFATAGETLMSFSDRRWGEGGVYEQLGFAFSGNTPPGYTYAKGLQRHSRERFQKHKLAALFPNFDAAHSEVQNCWSNGYYRVFDCGHSRWRMVL